MQSNKQSTRSLIAFLVTWSFLVLTLTGIVLYIVPQGRIAYWIHWSLAGMEKEQWAWVHMMFGGVFIFTGALHLYYNWKPFKTYLASRVKGHLELKREIFIATGLTLIIFAVSVSDLPPASWIIDLNERIKAAWVTSPELEPPFGHAEQVSLAGMSRRMDLDLDQAIQALEAEGIAFGGKRDTLEEIARANRTTPMAIYAIIRRHKAEAEPLATPQTVEQIEARYAGTGLGRKKLAEVCVQVGIGENDCLQRLARAGLSARADEITKDVAARYERNPIDLVVILLGAASVAGD